MKTKSELEKFQTRWRRWLGQKTRIDQPTYLTLLDSNWVAWAQNVCEDADIPYVALQYYSDRDKIKARFLEAIDHADMDDLHELDGLYVSDKYDL